MVFLCSENSPNYERRISLLFKKPLCKCCYEICNPDPSRFKVEVQLKFEHASDGILTSAFLDDTLCKKKLRFLK